MKKRDPLERPPSSSLAQQRAVERQMSDLLVELAEMTRQLNAQIDTRAAKLELLLREADDKLAALRRAIGGNVSSVVSLSPSPDATDAEVDPRHVEVYTLADQGRSPVEIAHHLRRPYGEVELILALRPAQTLGSGR
jgi:hypothetical protein